MSDSLTIVARITPVAGKEDELETAMKDLVRGTRVEPGCMQYDLHRTTENPCVFVFYENWESEAHWHAHMTGDVLWALNQKAGALIEDAEILQMKKIE